MIPVLLALVIGGQAPAAVTELARKAGLDAPVDKWCAGEFKPGHQGGYALAVSDANRGGRYVIVDANGAVTDLARYHPGADLACYSPAEASKLGRSISANDIVHGHITPRWKTTVVCGFVDDTSAFCWQYSPVEKRFVEVGRWIT